MRKENLASARLELLLKGIFAFLKARARRRSDASKFKFRALTYPLMK